MTPPSPAPVRLRQVVVVSTDLPGTSAMLQERFGLGPPFVDPGVAEFGLRNAVFAVGDCFVEVLEPVREGTAAGRYLQRRGGDAGYMAIFQMADLAGARRRVADLGIRVVWQADLGDIAGTHLHPADVPGAIVSLDRADPPASWHWAGPQWRGGAPADAETGGVRDLTVGAVDPLAMAERWAAVLDADVVPDEGATVRLGAAGQELRFVPVPSAAQEGIVEVGLDLDRPAMPGGGVEIAGVRFRLGPAAAGAGVAPPPVP